jgi:hypothetical protein
MHQKRSLWNRLKSYIPVYWPQHVIKTMCRLIQYDSHGTKLPSSHWIRELHAQCVCTQTPSVFMAFEYKVLRTLFEHSKEKETLDEEKCIWGTSQSIIFTWSRNILFLWSPQVQHHIQKIQPLDHTCHSSVHFTTPHFTPLKTHF